MSSLKFRNPTTGEFERLSTPLIKGKDGVTPHIGDNNNWWNGNIDTGVKALGEKGDPGDPGEDGLTPHIGANGNWFIGDTDTGVRADAESYTETDPTVPAWAKEPSKPAYTASEVGADVSGAAASALSSAMSYTDSKVPTKTSDLTNDSGFIDTTEAIDLISSHGSSVNGYANLTVEAGDNIGLTFKNGEPDAYGSSTEGTMTISATVPTKTSDLTNDSGFITGYTETDPTVPAWAKSASKPTYTYSEVGAAASSHTHTPASIGAAPAYTYGTADLTAGVSALATGQLHFVYEVGDDNSDAN